MIFPDCVLRYPAALFKAAFKILFNVGDTSYAVEVSRAFEMVVKAAVIKVNGADNRLPVVDDEGFRVDEAGDVLVNFYARVNEGGIVALRESIGGFLVRDARKNKRNVNAPFRGELDGVFHLAVEN